MPPYAELGGLVYCVYCGVTNSIVLYGAPIWTSAIKMDKYKAMLIGVQRKMALRVCSAYRTDSTEALQVIADTIPVDLLVLESTKLYEEGRAFAAYLQRIGKEETTTCWFCSEREDKAEHTLFKCQRWSTEREVAENETGTRLSPENLVPAMLIDENNWNTIATLMSKILKLKEAQEKIRGQ